MIANEPAHVVVATPAPPRTGAVALMRALLRDTLAGVDRGDTEAVAWVQGTPPFDDPDYVFSAPSVCAHLGVDLDAMRAAVAAVRSGQRGFAIMGQHNRVHETPDQRAVAAAVRTRDLAALQAALRLESMEEVQAWVARYGLAGVFKRRHRGRRSSSAGRAMRRAERFVIAATQAGLPAELYVDAYGDVRVYLAGVPVHLRRCTLRRRCFRNTSLPTQVSAAEWRDPHTKARGWLVLAPPSGKAQAVYHRAPVSQWPTLDELAHARQRAA